MTAKCVIVGNEAMPPGEVLLLPIFTNQSINFEMRRIFFLAFVLISFLGCQNKAASIMENKSTANSQHSANPYYSRTDTSALNLPDSDWKKVLPEDVYEVARHKATERAFTGKYWDFTGIGTYYCAACGNALFRSDAKFASTCGWPSFYEPIRKTGVIYEPDNSYGMQRTEVLCGRCGGHLGHIFDDGPPPTGKRFCMNSIVLEFEPDHDQKAKQVLEPAPVRHEK